MGNIKGKYCIKIHSDYAFYFTGDSGCRSTFWTDYIKYEDDGSITFEPINTTSNDNWPLTINVHMTNCVVLHMKK